MTHLHDEQDRSMFTAKHTGGRAVRDHLDQMASRRRRDKVVAPVPGFPVTFGYREPGPYEYGYHTGEDHACPVGSRCQAVSYGRVIGVGYGVWGAAYGNQVVIRTRDGKFDYAYCHLSKMLVSLGDQVVPGIRVAMSGDTGNTTGPHVHFEARTAGGHYGDDVNPIRVKRKS